MASCNDSQPFSVLNSISLPNLRLRTCSNLWQAFPHRITWQNLAGHYGRFTLPVGAALSTRVCIDLCLATPQSVSLAQEAVNSHLCLVTALDEHTGLLTTSTLSEPIVADTVADMLMADSGREWKRSLNTAGL